MKLPDFDLTRILLLSTKQFLRLLTSLRSILPGIFMLLPAIVLIFIALTPALVKFNDDNNLWWTVSATSGLSVWITYWSGFVLRRDEGIRYKMGEDDVVETNHGVLTIVTAVLGLAIAAIYEVPLPILLIAGIIQGGVYALSYGSDDLSEMVKNVFFHVCSVILMYIGVWMVLTG